MNLCQFSLKKRINALILLFLSLILLVTGCGSLTGAGTTSVSYTQGTRQVLIRLVDAPGNIFPSLQAIPTWELYSDGTLLYQSHADNSGTLLQAQLQPADVAHILDVVVNQDAFFADKKSLYGKLVPDVGSLALTVSANHQQKTVSIFDEMGAPSADQHMFAVLHFLQSYQPASSHPYAAPGAVVLVQPSSGTTAAPVQWPYSDISLKQIATQECPTLFPNSQGSCPASSGPIGYFPIYGKHGTGLLAMLKGQRALLVSQQGLMYLVQAWPLLPENLVVQPDGKQWVETEGMNGGRWPLLPGAH